VASARDGTPSPGDNLARILLVEDNEPLRATVAGVLTSAGFRVAACSTARAALDELEPFHPDLALVDVDLGDDMDGFELAELIRSRLDVPFVFLTAADSLEARLRGFELGADDYVVKPFAVAELVARVTAVLRRAGRLTSSTIEVFDVVIDESKRVATRSGVDLKLTALEFDILATLARYRGRPVSKRQLLALVWGFGELDPNVVEVHVSALRRKLEEQGPRLVHTERSAGYVIHA
jgi:DNA-binding response OmpR family regulator